MRLRGIHLAGLAAALVGAGATSEEAQAGDLTISTNTTAPVVTSNANAGPGDITIASAGAITLGTAGQTAITVDSNNDATNAGAILANNLDNVTGILLLPGLTGSATSSGNISLLEDHTLTDTDSDGDLDGDFATGVNRNAIWLQSGAAFNGNVTVSGALLIEGENSAAIRLDALLNGALAVSGNTSVVGDNSNAFVLSGGAASGVTGNVNLTGPVTVFGAGSGGLLANGAIGGQLNINGTWSVTGYHSPTRPVDVSHLDADDLLQAGSAVAIHYSVAGGVTIQGVGVEDDEDDDGDGVTEAAGDTNDDASANIQIFGSAPAILIQSDPSAILALGALATGQGAGFGFLNRGAVSAQGVYDGVNATALRIEGGATAVTTAGGVANDGSLSATAIEGNATAFYLGANATVPTFRNRRNVTALVASEGANNAVAVLIASGATLQTLTNSGTIGAQFFGETGNATAILDQSNSLGVINNSGTITALTTATDADPTDNVPPPPVTGSAVAIDLSGNSLGATINQTADVVFNDDDAIDGDTASRPAVKIVGDIRLGSGNDAINLGAGSIAGDVSFGAGADTFTITNGATYVGSITKGAGTLDLDVAAGGLSLTGGVTNIRDAHFGSTSTLSVLLGSTTIQGTGNITFDNNSKLALSVPGGLPAAGNEVFLTTTGTLTVGTGILGPISGPGTPFIYNFDVAQVGNTLEADFSLKTPTQLGLNTPQGAAFLPIIEAARTDASLVEALTNIDNGADFAEAYDDLLPSYSSAVTELATTAIQQSQSATTNRLTTTRVNGANDVSVWAQEIGYQLTRTPQDVNAQKFDGHGFGIAGGIDGPLDNGALFGLSASFIASEMSEDGRPQGEISTSLGQVNAYLGTALGPIDLDFIGGVGVGRMSERRFVKVGDFSARTDADWWAYEGHVSARASAPMSLADWLVITPQAQLTYVALQEQGYTEEGGGTGIDIDADEQFSQRLWADAGLDFAARFHTRAGTVIAPHIYAGYRANAIDEAAERTFRFVSTGTDFTLADETLGSGGPLVGLGIDASNGYSTFSLTYEGEIGDQIERHSINAAIRFRF